MERIHKWLLTTVQRIWDYLAKLLPALGKVTLALTKLSLFYVPFFICTLVFIFFHRHVGWVIAGVARAILITGIGLTYSKKRGTKQDENAKEMMEKLER